MAAAKVAIQPSHVGLLHENLGVPEGKNISLAELFKAKKSVNPKIRKRATFAVNMRGK